MMIGLYRNVMKEPCAEAGIDFDVVVDNLSPGLLRQNTTLLRKS